MIERLVGGSVREALVRRASIPVLVAWGGERGWPPARVVIWDDSSASARLAGELAASIGGLYGAGTLLLRVLPGVREAEGPHEGLEEPFTQWATRLERLGGRRPETRLVAGDPGRPALNAVAEEAEEGPALLALGASGSSAAKRLAGPGAPKRALGMVGGMALVGPQPARAGRDGKRRTRGADGPRRVARPATRRRTR